MKKFLSMVMAAAMVVSLVPATAFAADDDIKATASVVNAKNYTESEISGGTISGPELQLYFTTAKYTSPAGSVTDEYTVTLDNAEFDPSDFTSNGANYPSGNALKDNLYITADGTTYRTAPGGIFTDDGLPSDGSNELKDLNGNAVKVTALSFNGPDNDELTFTVEGKMDKGWTLAIPLDSDMDKTSKGKTATVSVEAEEAAITNADDLVYASVEAKGIKASVKKVKDVATEEYVAIDELKLEPAVGSTFGAVIAGTATDPAQIRLKLNSGFEFTNAAVTNAQVQTKAGNAAAKAQVDHAASDNDEIVINVTGDITTVDMLKVVNLEVEAVSAKAGSTATIKVYADGCDTVSVEVAKVVDYTVSMTVDEDEDVPVIYSGVDVDNTGITDDNDHEALEVTIKETFAGAWNNSKDFTLSLPEGVYIADEISTSVGGDFALKTGSDYNGWFEDAYKEGDYVDLTFERRTWNETNPDGPNDDPAEVSFTLKLVADPNFEGDVVLKLTGDAVEEQEVTIAKFVKPFVVEAQQNDMQIDYRNTEIPTSVVIKEAEAGLWAKDTVFKLALDKISFDDEGTVTVDEKSGLELKDDKVRVDGGDNIYFTVSSRSDDEPAVVTISGMQLYMQRSLPAGAYDLDVWSPTMLYGENEVVEAGDGYMDQVVLNGAIGKDPATATRARMISDINEDFYSTTAKAGFVNIVTAGREDTESFTTKVVVPVGESYLISGENKVEIPVPAYINAAGYTMLPLRAVAVALGINSNNVLWDQSTRTATIMYGSKIINMTYGQKVVYVNGAMIPATAAVEITNDRMFLGLRDLGNALGVTDIAWDGATKTATLNGNK